MNFLNQESRIKNQESRIKNQESRIKNQESRIKNHTLIIFDSGIKSSFPSKFLQLFSIILATFLILGGQQ